MTTQTTEHRIACLLRRLLLLLLKQEKQSPLSQQCSSAALSPPSTVKILTLHLVSPSPFVLVPCCCCCHLLVKSKKSKILLLLLCLKTKPKPKKHHPTFFSSFFLQVPKPAILQNQSKPSCPRHSLCTKPSPAKPHSTPPPPSPKPSNRPAPAFHHACARRVPHLRVWARSSWTLNDAGGATAPGRPPKSSQEPLNKGPFPLQNGRSAKPTVRHLSFSLSKSPEGTLRQRKTMQKALKGTSNTLPFPSVQTQNSPKKKKK